MKTFTVDEVLSQITATKKENGQYDYNRYSKSNVSMLLNAIINDPDFAIHVAKVKSGELSSVDELKVTEAFRRFCATLLEKFGVDKAESEKVMSAEFKFDFDASAVMDVAIACVQKYIEVGNTFDLFPQEDFKGSIRMKNVPASTKVSDAYSPQTREYLGKFETSKPAHRQLVVKSSCPKFLVNRRKIVE